MQITCLIKKCEGLVLWQTRRSSCLFKMRTSGSCSNYKTHVCEFCASILTRAYSSVFQHQSEVHIQREICISAVTDKILLSQLPSLSLHIMGTKFSLWRDLRGLLHPRNLYKLLWETIEIRVFLDKKTTERRKFTQEGWFLQLAKFKFNLFGI